MPERVVIIQAAAQTPLAGVASPFARLSPRPVPAPLPAAHRQLASHPVEGPKDIHQIVAMQVTHDRPLPFEAQMHPMTRS
jgi:hypothetical protein